MGILVLQLKKECGGERQRNNIVTSDRYQGLATYNLNHQVLTAPIPNAQQTLTTPLGALSTSLMTLWSRGPSLPMLVTLPCPFLTSPLFPHLFIMPPLIPFRHLIHLFFQIGVMDICLLEPHGTVFTSRFRPMPRRGSLLYGYSLMVFIETASLI